MPDFAFYGQDAHRGYKVAGGKFAPAHPHEFTAEHVPLDSHDAAEAHANHLALTWEMPVSWYECGPDGTAPARSEWEHAHYPPQDGPGNTVTVRLADGKAHEGMATTEHSASSYGLPVVVVDGEAYGAYECVIVRADAGVVKDLERAGYGFAQA